MLPKLVIMTIQEAYNVWADQYDTNANKTRDLEGAALRQTLSTVVFQNCLEIGCGTGKNTTWLCQKANKVIAIDLSEEMLAKAKAKIDAANVHFVQADITQPWEFAEKITFDIVTFSLVLEHIEDLNSVLQKAASVLQSGGYVYIGELHPFKQYTGSQARFDTDQGRHMVTCFVHNISDFTAAAQACGLQIIQLNEHFDQDNQTEIPRILTLLLRKMM